MTAVRKSAIFHIRNISRFTRYLTAAATAQVIHVFVTSRLDVGNALLAWRNFKFRWNCCSDFFDG